MSSPYSESARENGGKTGLMAFFIMGTLFLLTAVYTVTLSANVTPPQLPPLPAASAPAIIQDAPAPLTVAAAPAVGDRHRLANLAALPQKPGAHPHKPSLLAATAARPAAAAAALKQAEDDVANSIPGASLNKVEQAARAKVKQEIALAAKPAASAPAAAKVAAATLPAKGGLTPAASKLGVVPPTRKAGISGYEGVKSGHVPKPMKAGQLPAQAHVAGVAGQTVLSMRPESAKAGQAGAQSALKTGQVGLGASARRGRLVDLALVPNSDTSRATLSPEAETNSPLTAEEWSHGWGSLAPFSLEVPLRPETMVSGYRSRAPPFSKAAIQVPAAVKTGFAAGGVKHQPRRATPPGAKQGHATPPMTAKLGISGGGVKFGLDVNFAKSNGHVPSASKHGRIPAADIVPLATKPGTSPFSVKMGQAPGGPLPRALKLGQANGLLHPNWGKSGLTPGVVKGGTVSIKLMPGTAAKVGSLHEQVYTLKNGMITAKSGMAGKLVRQSTRGVGRPDAGPSAGTPPAAAKGTLRRLLQATAATLGNPVTANAAVQSMVQGQVQAAAAVTTVAAPTTAAAAAVATTAATPTVAVAATAAALPVATTAGAVLPAAATAAAQLIVSGPSQSGPTNTPGTPLWAQAMGKNLPASIPLPPAGYPPATVYVVNYLSKDLFFKQANKIYNSIPAHAVAKQESFGGEQWDIVDALGSVYKHLTITQNNQRVEIKALY